ncbi:MAG: hypothetical protein AAGA84_09030, partial [Pseudomonadota bacterium]
MRQSFYAVVVAAIGCVTAAAGHAQTIDLNVNNDTVRAGFIGNPTERGLRIDAGWLHNQDRGDVIHIGV